MESKLSLDAYPRVLDWAASVSRFADVVAQWLSTVSSTCLVRMFDSLSESQWPPYRY